MILHGYGIDIEGTNVIVKIAKAKEQPEIIDNNTYCDIVAKKSGIITKIIAQNGMAYVNVGDSVNKGDVLIKGIMEGKYTEPRKVHSLGIVEAEVVYGKTKEVFFTEEILKETGKKEKKYEIIFKDKLIKLYTNESKFENYETEKIKRSMKLFKNFYLPISINKIENKEQIKETKQYTLKEAIDYATRELTGELDKELEGKGRIIDRQLNTTQNEKSVIVTLNYKIIEEIGENKI